MKKATTIEEQIKHLRDRKVIIEDAMPEGGVLKTPPFWQNDSFPQLLQRRKKFPRRPIISAENFSPHLHINHRGVSRRCPPPPLAASPYLPAKGVMYVCVLFLHGLRVTRDKIDFRFLKTVGEWVFRLTRRHEDMWRKE